MLSLRVLKGHLLNDRGSLEVEECRVAGSAAQEQMGRVDCGSLEAQVEAEKGKGEDTGKQMMELLLEAMKVKVAGGGKVREHRGINAMEERMRSWPDYFPP